MLVANPVEGDMTENIAAGHIRIDEEIFADRDALKKCLSPLIRIMKFTGSYFENCFDSNKCVTGITGNKVQSYDNKLMSNFAATYSAVLTILVWIIAIRLCTAFDANERFDESLINKLVIAVVHCETAVVKTAYYFASRSGKLDHLLRQVRVTPDFVRVLRKTMIMRIVTFAISSAVFAALFLYAIFFTNGKFDFFVAPFVTRIPVNDQWLNVTKWLFVLVDQLVLHSFIWSLTMNQILIEILLRQFKIVNNQFGAACSRRGRFLGKLKTFRNRHQELCRFVQTVDSFQMITNATIFGGQMFVLVIMLYGFIIVGYPDQIVLGVYVMLFVIAGFTLAYCTMNGSLLNYSVRTAHNDLIRRITQT